MQWQVAEGCSISFPCGSHVTLHGQAHLWQKLWLASAALGRLAPLLISDTLAVALGESSPPTMKVLELGAGCGLGSLSAAAYARHIGAQAHVAATDAATDAVEYLTATIELNHLSSSACARVLNWNRLDTSADPAPNSVDLLLGADILYIQANVSLVLAAINTLLAPNGLAVITCPGRCFAEEFLDRAEEAGFQCRSWEWQNVRLMRLNGRTKGLRNLRVMALWRGSQPLRLGGLEDLLARRDSVEMVEDDDVGGDLDLVYCVDMAETDSGIGTEA